MKPAIAHRDARRVRGPAASAVGALTVACFLAPSVHAQATSFQFAPAIVRPFGTAHFPTHIAAADLNGDGALDLVLPGRDADGVVFYVLGNGDGTFGPLQQVVVATQTDWAELRDFDGDTKLDLALAIRSFDGRVAVIRGNGDGTFSDQVAYYQVGRETRALACADFDGDGDVDIAAANNFSADVVVLLNDGRGVFTAGQRTLINEYVAGYVYPQQVSAADIDGDRDSDLVLTSIGSGRISILRNNGDATFAAEIAYAPPMIGDQRPAVTNSVLVDMDGDGDLDIVSPLGYIGTVLPRFGVFRNDGRAAFAAAETFSANPNGSISWVPAAGDIDGDGRPDLALGYGIAGDLSLVRNISPTGQLAFAAPQVSTIGDFVRFILLADLDDDCDADLVLVEVGSHTFRTFLNLTPQVSGCSAGAAGVAGIAGGSGGPVRTTAPLAPDRDLTADSRLDAADLAARLAADPAIPTARPATP